MAATTIVQAVLVWLQQRTLLRLETKLALAGSAKFIWHVLRLPAVFFTQRHTGDIATRVSANDRIAVLLSGDLGTSMVNTLTIVFYGVAMATLIKFSHSSASPYRRQPGVLFAGQSQAGGPRSQTAGGTDESRFNRRGGNSNH